MGPDTGSDVRVFGKDSTIIINVGDNQKVKALEVMRDIEQLYGKGMVYACVPKSGDCFEVTLANKAMADKLTTGVTIQDKHFDCNLLYSNIIVVSFMHLPAYITDMEIKLKLASYGIALKSQIKRRYYKGTRCADGTRFVEVTFPPHIKSLNYLMKFDTVHGPQLFRVKHNNQTKVCSLCLSEDHLVKDCPDFKCFKCGVQGHAKRFCTAERCRECGRNPVNCICQAASKDDEDEETGQQEENSNPPDVGKNNIDETTEKVASTGVSSDVEGQYVDAEVDDTEDGGDCDDDADDVNATDGDGRGDVNDDAVDGDDGDDVEEEEEDIDMGSFDLEQPTGAENDILDFTFAECLQKVDVDVKTGEKSKYTDQSELLIDFASPVENPDENINPMTEETFTPQPSEASRVSVNNSDEMDTNENISTSGQQWEIVNRRSKRKNKAEKANKAMKRMKEVLESIPDENPSTEKNDVDIKDS